MQRPESGANKDVSADDRLSRMLRIMKHILWRSHIEPLQLISHIPTRCFRIWWQSPFFRSSSWDFPVQSPRKTEINFNAITEIVFHHSPKALKIFSALDFISSFSRRDSRPWSFPFLDRISLFSILLMFWLALTSKSVFWCRQSDSFIHSFVLAQMMMMMMNCRPANLSINGRKLWTSIDNIRSVFRRSFFWSTAGRHQIGMFHSWKDRGPPQKREKRKCAMMSDKKANKYSRLKWKAGSPDDVSLTQQHDATLSERLTDE